MEGTWCEIGFVGGAKDGHKMQFPGKPEDQPKVIRHAIDQQQPIVVPRELIDRTAPVNSAVRTAQFINSQPRAPVTSVQIYELRNTGGMHRYYFVRAISQDEMNALAKRIFLGEATKDDPMA